MSLQRRLLQPLYSRALTSPATRRLWQLSHDWLAGVTGQTPALRLWIGFDDPESYLLVQSLSLLLERYDALPLEISLLPSRAPLSALETLNAWHLAQQHQLSFHSLTPPRPENCRLAERILMASTEMTVADRLCLLRQLFVCVWEHHSGKLETLALRFPPVTPDEALQNFEVWAAHSESGGQATRLVYQGESFIGLDELPDLAGRLAESTSGHPDSGFLVNDPEMLAGIRSHHYGLDFYFCFRDPYSYLSLDGVIALSDHYGLQLRLLPVTLPDDLGALDLALLPPAGLLWRAARRAARHRQPFGEVCLPDPSGVRHCHALLAYAAEHGRERQMARSLLSGIWAEGRDMDFKPHRAAILRQVGFGRTAPESIPLTDTMHRETHDAWSRLGLSGMPALVLHIDKLLVLYGSDRVAALDMALADTLNNKNME